MKAFLMAAGIGSRIKDVTTNPKCLLKINNKSIIKNTIEMLLEKNIEISIVVGFKKELIEEELKNYNINIIENEDYNNSNSIISLFKVIDKLEDECIIANADVFWTKDILNILLENNDFNNAIMLGDKSINRLKYGDYFLKTINNKIIDYGKELKYEDRNYEYVGISKIKSGFINEFKNKLKELVKCEKKELWWENVLYELSSSYDINVLDINNLFWGEVDTPKDYQKILNWYREVSC